MSELRRAERRVRIETGEAAIAAAAALLRAGGVVAIPTETVYGLGADASNDDAVRRVFRAKGRPAGHPLIVHLADASAVSMWSHSSDPRVSALAEAFWPGPLTIIVAHNGRPAPSVTGERSTVGLRVPDHELTRAILAEFGGGVAAPSANRFGRISPTTAAHVAADLGGDVDLIVDGGPCGVGLESTIVELDEGAPAQILRPGGVSVDAIETVLGAPVIDGPGGPARAPGMLASHYAPDATVIILDAADRDAWIDRPATVVIAPRSLRCAAERLILLPDDAQGYARDLYAALRDADAQSGIDTIAVIPPRRGDLLPAVLDRLRKAAAPRG